LVEEEKLKDRCLPKGQRTYPEILGATFKDLIPLLAT
jgi:hypothetical protein